MQAKNVVYTLEDSTYVLLILITFFFSFFFPGKFKSSAVIDALIYLAVHDPEPNVRSVATISLAQTEITEKEKIEELTKVLKDDDRLVREAGCLTLGHLQVKDAIDQLLHLW